MSQDHDTEHGETEETFEDAVHEQEFAPDAMLAHMSERKPLPPGDLKRLLSQRTRKKDTTDDKDQQPTEIEVNVAKHRQVKMRRLRYQYMDRTPSSRDDNHGALVDALESGAKGLTPALFAGVRFKNLWSKSKANLPPLATTAREMMPSSSIEEDLEDSIDDVAEGEEEEEGGSFLAVVEET